MLGKFVIKDATEEVRQEEKTAQPILLLASSNLGDEILVRGVDLSRPDKFIPNYKNHPLKGIIELIKIRKEIGKH